MLDIFHSGFYADLARLYDITIKVVITTKVVRGIALPVLSETLFLNENISEKYLLISILESN